ncbi:hypothetical protein GCK32_009510, partial [Trichostrongylus colubriformis]
IPANAEPGTGPNVDLFPEEISMDTSVEDASERSHEPKKPRRPSSQGSDYLIVNMSVDNSLSGTSSPAPATKPSRPYPLRAQTALQLRHAVSADASGRSNRATPRMDVEGLWSGPG